MYLDSSRLCWHRDVLTIKVFNIHQLASGLWGKFQLPFSPWQWQIVGAGWKKKKKKTLQTGYQEMEKNNNFFTSNLNGPHCNSPPACPYRSLEGLGALFHLAGCLLPDLVCRCPWGHPKQTGWEDAKSEDRAPPSGRTWVPGSHA